MAESEDKKEEVLDEDSTPEKDEDPAEVEKSREDADSAEVEESGEDESSDNIDLADALAETGATKLDAPVLADELGFYGTIDRVVFKLEVVIVVTALIIMSIAVFTDVAYQTMVAISQDFRASNADAYTLSALLLSFIGAMAFAAAGSGEKERSLGFRLGVTVAVLIGSSLFGYALLHLESSTVYRALLVAHVIPVALYFQRNEEKKRLGILVVSTVLAFVLFGELPTGYSWAQSYSLLLLLWVGFLGASMAARQRRHLRVDLARKLLSPEKLPWFNAVSYATAAVFSAVVLYLGYIYIFGPDSTYIRPIWEAPAWLPEGLKTTLTSEFPLPDDAPLWRRALQVFFAPSEPGEIPDWLKVMAIPVSLLFITIRFLGHAFAFTRMGLRKESFSEMMGAH